MPNFGYSYKGTGAKFAKAQVHDVDASYKDLGAVCDAIRHKGTEQALELLEKVAEGNTPILFRKHNKHLGHRRELGGKKGRYPRKAAKLVLAVLKNAVANASHKGLGDDLIVAHACANKQLILPRMAPKGRSRRSNYETAKIELVVEESLESKKSLDKVKERAKAVLSKADRDKLVNEEAKKLTAHIRNVVKKKASEKKEGEVKEETNEVAPPAEEKKEDEKKEDKNEVEMKEGNSNSLEHSHKDGEPHNHVHEKNEKQ
ncbi:MAG: 50S ribosomal protein L22 [Candidatus Micrarchaeota archaeon]